MEEKISIWLLGNIGLRSPNRIQDGFRVFAKSIYVQNLHGQTVEKGFMDLLNERGIINNKPGKDASASHARKWRLMFSRHGFTYPKVKTSDPFEQSDLGPIDGITPFGETFLRADTFPAVQECYLRAMTVEQNPIPNDTRLFSPLRWTLAIMLELERRTGSSELTRIEFALWVQTTNPLYDIQWVVDQILDLRGRRSKAPSKRVFDKKEIQKRGKNYDKKTANFLDYADMNMRYLRITGVLQRRGRGLSIVPLKHVIVEQIAKDKPSEKSLKEAKIELCNGANLPLDDIKTAKEILDDLMVRLKDRGILYDISDLVLDSPTQINIARRRLEKQLFETDELLYASQQRSQWKEISDYMKLLIKGGGTHEYDEDYVIEVPKDETPAYLEWILWRAALAIDHLENKPFEVRGFKIDADFLPVSTAGGGQGDLYLEFEDFTIVTEVTMSTSSRQEAMEGEPVRRHVSDAVLMYDKPVYGLFVAVKIDTNTAETFRHGVWYTKEDKRQNLTIVPFTLEQFRTFFVSMFKQDKVSPNYLQRLILECSNNRDRMGAVAWKEYITTTVQQKRILS